jgi:small nuclear ribonucleoprotein (snRNP)-like protein
MHVHILLHDDQIIRGTFVAFDWTMDPVLRDCVELHPQAGQHVPRPLSRGLHRRWLGWLPRHAPVHIQL